MLNYKKCKICLKYKFQQQICTQCNYNICKHCYDIYTLRYMYHHCPHCRVTIITNNDNDTGSINRFHGIYVANNTCLLTKKDKNILYIILFIIITTIISYFIGYLITRNFLIPILNTILGFVIITVGLLLMCIFYKSCCECLFNK